eukprot:m.1180317 g.1180317  ORF g.1180317 m.1180317 type:complete len:149 (+) comp24532_c0_seq24:2498-2944(+)
MRLDQHIFCRAFSSGVIESAGGKWPCSVALTLAEVQCGSMVYCRLLFIEMMRLIVWVWGQEPAQHSADTAMNLVMDLAIGSFADDLFTNYQGSNYANLINTQRQLRGRTTYMRTADAGSAYSHESRRDVLYTRTAASHNGHTHATDDL